MIVTCFLFGHFFNVWKNCVRVGKFIC